MADFYQDNRRRTLFHEQANRFGRCAEPTTCEVGVLEWSPGKMITQPCIAFCLLLTHILGVPFGTGPMINTDAQALLSRAQPRVQIV